MPHRCATYQSNIVLRQHAIGEAAVTCYWSLRIIPPTPFDVSSPSFVFVLVEMLPAVSSQGPNKTRIRITTVTNLQCRQTTVTYPESDTRECIPSRRPRPSTTSIALTVLYQANRGLGMPGVLASVVRPFRSELRICLS